MVSATHTGATGGGRGAIPSTCKFIYDNAGRKISESIAYGGDADERVVLTTTSQYDSANRRKQINYPDGSIVGRTYTARNQLHEVRYNGKLVDTRSYDLGGRKEFSVLGNGVTVEFGYRLDNLIESIGSLQAAGASSKVDDYNYSYDDNKNKTGEAITGLLAGHGFGDNDSTGYDDENRLTAWSRQDGQLDQSWDLSLVGDWDSMTRNAVPTRRTYNAAHEITAIGDDAVTHDDNGNMVRPGDGRRGFQWTLDRKLAGVWIRSNPARVRRRTRHENTYDALGRRIQTILFVPGARRSLASSVKRIYFAYDGQQMIYQRQQHAPAKSQRYVYGSYIDEPILKDGVKSDDTTRETVFYSRNQQYSVTALTNSSGDVVERYAYSPYGETTIFNAAGSVIYT